MRDIPLAVEAKNKFGYELVAKMTSPLAAAINADLDALVMKVFPHLKPEDENFRICTELAQSRVHRHTFLSPDVHKIKRALKG